MPTSAAVLGPAAFVSCTVYSPRANARAVIYATDAYARCNALASAINGRIGTDSAVQFQAVTGQLAVFGAVVCGGKADDGEFLYVYDSGFQTYGAKLCQSLP